MNSCIVGIRSPSHRQRAKFLSHNGDPPAGRPSAFPVPSGLWTGQRESLCFSLMYAHFYLELPAQAHLESWLHCLSTGMARPLAFCVEGRPSLGSSIPFTVHLTAPVPGSLFLYIQSAQQHRADGAEISWAWEWLSITLLVWGRYQSVNTRNRRRDDRQTYCNGELRRRKGEEEDVIQDSKPATEKVGLNLETEWENEHLIIQCDLE